MDWRRTLPSPRHEVTNELSGELAHVKKRARSPSPLSVHPRDRDREHEQGREREKDKKPTQPFLPPIPRYEPRPKFSTTLAQEAEYARLDAHRANVAAEHRKTGKAWRRALHELDMATLELRAAQHRRELAENLRKRAHAGALGIDANMGTGTTQGGSTFTMA
ncbi:hypothetical protein BKA82DRAFT_3106904 [Pisolithus tinctorius]|nr:hypothetical protein BKA82DRAFT_3106904 [Pisolithus tinctorius]